MLPVTALAEPCSLCGSGSDLCLMDEYGVVYCSGTLVSYLSKQDAVSDTVREGTRMIEEWAFDHLLIQEVVLPKGIVMMRGLLWTAGS